ncbi:MAG: septum formation initiator family protein [Actinomycetota bacterium]
MAREDERSLAGVVLPVLVVAALAALVLAGLAVLPAKTWFSQRQKMAEAEAEVARLEAETADLEAELRLLATDEEIERRARRDFDLVFPGEESYRIVQDEGASSTEP